jgi:hypothetical protein
MKDSVANLVDLSSKSDSRASPLCDLGQTVQPTRSLCSSLCNEYSDNAHLVWFFRESSEAVHRVLCSSWHEANTL